MMDEEKKQYPITGDIARALDRVNALNGLRDRYIKLRFLGYRLAKRAAIEAENTRSDLWEMVYALYPEIRGKRLTLNRSTMSVEEVS